MIMKRATMAKTFAITVATALALGIAPKAKAQPGCSNATLMGTFAYTSTGFITTATAGPVGPFGEVGTQTFDGHGKAPTGTATVSANGTLYQLTITGTYTVNSDCTGTLTLQATFPPSTGIGTVPFKRFFVIDSIGTEFQAIETGTSVVGGVGSPGNVITSIYRRILLLP
jgi:hypothetical protein